MFNITVAYEKEASHGYPPIHLPRPHLTRILYDGFKEHKERIKTSVHIQDIEINELGVTVRLKDGSIEKGCIIIGCDGVHSQTRNISM
jgi:2-polyprenyl-6-methoxyphenol hydroxylase-like FAD-dependent oxidoreductase